MYGFLSSQELFDDGALNLGLYDQQAAFRWVQVSSPTKVFWRHMFAHHLLIVDVYCRIRRGKIFLILLIRRKNDLTFDFVGSYQREAIWTVCRSLVYWVRFYRLPAFSLLSDTTLRSLHLTTPPATPPLFHGAYLFSGSSFPYADYSNRQVYYDSVVSLVNCTGPESLACLRTVPTANLTAAMNAQPSIFSYEALKNTWFPVMDGIGGFTPELTNEVIRRGDYANVPIVSSESRSR